MRGRFAVRLALIGLLAAGAVVGCSNNDEEAGPQTGVLSVRITDAPAQFDQVNLVVTQVAVFRGSTLPADSDSVAGWQVVRSSSVTVTCCDFIVLPQAAISIPALENCPTFLLTSGLAADVWNARSAGP